MTSSVNVLMCLSAYSYKYATSRCALLSINFDRNIAVLKDCA